MVDITERKQMELALQESEAKFRAVFERIMFGAALTDLQGRIMESNHAYQKMLGYSPGELHRRLFTEFSHPEDGPVDLDLYKELAAGKRDHYEMEKRYLQKGGELGRSYLIVYLVRNVEGKPLLAIRMEKDLTGFKESASD